MYVPNSDYEAIFHLEALKESINFNTDNQMDEKEAYSSEPNSPSRHRTTSEWHSVKHENFTLTLTKILENSTYKRIEKKYVHDLYL